MPTIDISVKKKKAFLSGGVRYIVHDNSDYAIDFTFDDEWADEMVKTARFAFSDSYIDVPFTGNSVAVPVISTGRIVEVGVFAGDLRTTTGAPITLVPSIRSKNGTPVEPESSVYDKIMDMLDTLAGITATDETLENAKATGGIGWEDTEIHKIDEKYLPEQDLSAYRTATAQDEIDATKQDKFVAGENITIAEDGKTISASGVEVDGQTIVKDEDGKLRTAVGGYFKPDGLIVTTFHEGAYDGSDVIKGWDNLVIGGSYELTVDLIYYGNTETTRLTISTVLEMHKWTGLYSANFILPQTSDGAYHTIHLVYDAKKWVIVEQSKDFKSDYLKLTGPTVSYSGIHTAIPSLTMPYPMLDAIASSYRRNYVDPIFVAIESTDGEHLDNTDLPVPHFIYVDLSDVKEFPDGFYHGHLRNLREVWSGAYETSTFQLYGGNLTSLPNLKRVTLPLTEMGGELNDCTSLRELIITATSKVAKLDSYDKSLENTPISEGYGFIYVPDALVDGYKSDWGGLAEQIIPVSKLKLYTELMRGTTTDITPTDVRNALKLGTPIYLEALSADSTSTGIIFTDFQIVNGTTVHAAYFHYADNAAKVTEINGNLTDNTWAVNTVTLSATEV